MWGCEIDYAPRSPTLERREIWEHDGAVYGMLRHNGRLLYASDAIDGRDDEYDLSSLTGQRVTATGAMTALNRRQMTEQLRQLASLNHFAPGP